MTDHPLNLHSQHLFRTVPILDQEVLLGHEGLSTFLHPQQVGESLRTTEKTVSVHQTSNVSSSQILGSGRLTSDLRGQVVHRGHGDVEDQAGHDPPSGVADREDKLDKQRVGSDVLYRRHEGHLHVCHCMLQGQRRGGTVITKSHDPPRPEQLRVNKRKLKGLLFL